MDETGYGIVAQTAAKAATEIYVHLIDAGQLPEGGFSAGVWDMAYSHIGGKIIGSFRKAYQAEQQGAPFVPPPQTQAPPVDPMQIPPPPPPFPPQGTTTAPPPVPPSQPVAQPSAPQPVLSGPPCPNCQTPTVMTKDYPAKKARNLSEGKKPPPMWKCPLGSYDWNTKTPQGCQGSIWEPDPVVTA